MASVYKKTTKFLSLNTTNLLKKMPNTRKYRLLTKVMEDCDPTASLKLNKCEIPTDDEIDDLGERDLDYYLGVRQKEVYWRDPVGKEQIRKDFLINHCGITEDEYDKKYKTLNSLKVSFVTQPKLKQVPFKIHKKKSKKDFHMCEGDSWREKTGIFKLFRRDSEYSTSESYSEYDSNEDDKISEDVRENDVEENIDRGVAKHFNYLSMYDGSDDMLSLEVDFTLLINLVSALQVTVLIKIFPCCRVCGLKRSPKEDLATTARNCVRGSFHTLGGKISLIA